MHRVIAEGSLDQLFRIDGCQKYDLENCFLTVWEMRPHTRTIIFSPDGQRNRVSLAFPYTQVAFIKDAGFFFGEGYITCSKTPIESLSQPLSRIPLPLAGPRVCLHPEPTNIEEFISLFWQSEFLYPEWIDREAVSSIGLRGYDDWIDRTKVSPESILEVSWENLAKTKYSIHGSVRSYLLENFSSHVVVKDKNERGNPSANSRGQGRVRRTRRR